MKKTNFIASVAFVAVLIYVFALLKPATVRTVQTKVMSLLSPFIKAGAVTETEVKHAVEAPVDIASLRRDNEVLQQKVEQLRIFAQKYEQLLEENNKFRAMLNYRKLTPFKLTAARVLRRSASNWWTTVILDKGSMDGIGTDCPVITDVGLVGKTGKVALHTAEVMLLTDEQCQVAARVEGSQAKGILTGERGGLEVRPDLRLRFLDRTTKIEAGAKVYSYGVDGGVFPAGVYLGKVKSFQPRDVSEEASVEPAVDFSLLEDVFVVQPQPDVAPEKVEKPEKAQK